MGRKATLTEVARRAGVSPATVDRVLNDRGGVRPEKQRRVLTAARELRLDRALAPRFSRLLRVAVLIQPAKNPFHGALAEAFGAAGRADPGLNLQFLLYTIDPNDPAATAAAVTAQGATHDALIVTRPDHPAIAAAIRAAAARVPVVTLATDLPDSGRHAYVGPDDRQAGRVAGDLMGRLLQLSGGGEVLMIAGLRRMTGHVQREAGFRAVLAEHYPACRLVAVVESREDAERAGHLALTALGENPALRGLYHASAGAGAVVEALRRRGRPDVVVITHELTADRRALLKARALHAVVDQDPAAEVSAAVATVARLLGRLPGEPGSTVTPIRIFTAENV